MNRHDDIRELLHDFVDHELPADRQDDVALHLAECATCAADVDSLHALRTAAQDLPLSVAPDDDLWGAIDVRLGDSTSSFQGIDRHAWTMRLTWAVAAVLAFALIWTRGDGEEGPLKNLTQSYDTVRHDGELALSSDNSRLDISGRNAMTDGMNAIDDAIRETQIALDAVADAPEQFRHLADGYQKKIDLLQRLVRRAARP